MISHIRKYFYDSIFLSLAYLRHRGFRLRLIMFITEIAATVKTASSPMRTQTMICCPSLHSLQLIKSHPAVINYKNSHRYMHLEVNCFKHYIAY